MASVAERFFLLFAATALLLLLLSPPASAVNVEYCKKGADYPVKVSGIEITPYPIVRGEPATFNISANTGDELSEGKLIIDVKYFWFHVYQETHDLCKETSCPVLVGDFVLSHQQTLPSYTPPGSYTLTMTLMGAQGEQLTCIAFDFSIGFVSVADS
ncbi:phosphatidylglycerol/phosphatidylinositol transfer protein [Canna indica]|uniref:Phosphatidylglycerol/phosphatidylinositol transfer protein n=1 Tax=Canna indica TaxID=4628 RepID=A0AAQ3QEE6_9LILI|nr:phosphatidylglycerol/phosphatidylinositol transfer protein [Canna indica]